MPRRKPSATTSGARIQTQLRLLLDAEIALGPGKADLLEAIDASGSISAAGKRLGMSYRRAWLLVDTMNRCFHQPLVRSSPGGSGGGGAVLTEEGRAVLQQYRQLEREVAALTGRAFEKLQPLLLKSPRPSQG